MLVQKLTALDGYSRPAENRSCVGSCTFPTMIASWRKHWHEASGGATPAQVPFGFMQLSTWSDQSERNLRGWADARRLRILRRGRREHSNG